MKVAIPLLLCFLLCHCYAVSAADNEGSSSTGGDILDSIWNGIVKVKQTLEPHVRYGASRAKAFVVGESDSRGARATNVTIINRTNKNLLLVRDHCNSGKFSEGMLPPEILPATSEKVYGTQSTTIGRGAECQVKYASKDGSWVSVDTNNPYFKSNTMTADASTDLKLEQTLGSGHYNEVLVKISNAF